MCNIMQNNYDRQILALRDAQLEQFINNWIGCKGKGYVEVARFSGAGDMGRDVVGFLSKKRHEGPWHNYQCKQYGKKISTETGILEIGKILYYAHLGEFSVPEQYFFVAPRGVNRNLEKLIYNPSQFKATLIDGWDQYCSTKIVHGSTISLDDDLKTFISAFDFSSIERFTLDNILEDAYIDPVLHKWFGKEIGQAPQGQTPAEIQDSELPYITQLVGAYSQHCGQIFADYREVEKQPDYSNHLSLQRERFYDADAFKRFYRDNTESDVLDSFEKDIYHGVIDTFNAEHKDSLARVNAVMTQASNLQATGPLSKYARIPVKQGVCHHLANEGDLIKWHQ